MTVNVRVPRVEVSSASPSSCVPTQDAIPEPPSSLQEKSTSTRAAQGHPVAVDAGSQVDGGRATDSQAFVPVSVIS